MSDNPAAVPREEKNPVFFAEAPILRQNFSYSCGSHTQNSHSGRHHSQHSEVKCQSGVPP